MAVLSEEDIRQAIASLSEGQRECLKLVAMHRSSKEIARALGISKDTVDQRLDRARRLLGVATRADAARLYAASCPPYDRMVYDPQAVAPASNDGEQAHVVSDDTQRQGSAPVREDQAPYGDVPPGLDSSLPLRMREKKRNDLTIGKRLIWILLIGAAVPVLLGSLLEGLLALGRIGAALTH